MPVVHYGAAPDALALNATGEVFKFVGDGNPDGLQYMNRITLTDLVPGARYFYACTSGTNTSATYAFSAMRTDLDWSPSFLVVRAATGACLF